MPAWLLRLVWRVRGKRRVRLQMVGDLPSIEGVQIGKWGGCHVLANATLLRSESETVTLDGITEVAFARVFFAQVLT